MSYRSIDDLVSSMSELEAKDDQSVEATEPTMHRRALVTQMHNELISRTPPNDLEWPNRMSNYGAWILKQYRRSNKPSDLANAISKVSAAAQAASDDHPSKARISKNLSTLYTMQHNRTGSPEELDFAINAAEKAVSLIHTDSGLDRTVVFTLLVASLSKRYQLEKREDDIRRAIDLGGQVVSFTPAAHRERAQILTNFVVANILLYGETNVLPETDELDRLITLAQEAVDRTTSGDVVLKARLVSLGTWLSAKADRDDNVDDINYLIRVVEQLLSFPNTDSSQRMEQLARLSNMYWYRYSNLDLPADRNRSIETLEHALRLAKGQPAEVSLLDGLRTRLLHGNRPTESCDDLERAISITQKLANWTKDVSQREKEISRQLVSQMDLGKYHQQKFSRSKDLNDINKAIKVACEMCRVELGEKSLSGRSAMRGRNEAAAREIAAPDSDKLGLAVDLGDEALASPGEALQESKYANSPLLTRRLEAELFDAPSDQEILDGWPNFDGIHPLIVAALGTWLGQKATHTGDRTDLNRSIRILTTAIEMEKGPDYDDDSDVAMMSNLANCYKSRSIHTSALTDLNYAVRWSGKAVELSNSARDNELGILGMCYGARGDRTRSVDDLYHAVDATEKALKLCSTKSMKAHHLANLGNYLHRICILEQPVESPGNPSTVGATLDRAIRSAGQAMDLLAEDRQKSFGVIFSLANLHALRYERNRTQDDLEKSIDLTRQGLTVLPGDHAERAPQLTNLAWSLQLLFEKNKHPGDRTSAIETYQMASSHPQSTVSSRIDSARLGAAFISSQSQWKEAYQLCASAIDLLPQLDLRIMSNADRLHLLENFQGLSSIATAAALNASHDEDVDADIYVSEALKALEQGRGLISSMILEDRTDLSVLEKQHSVLAREFDSVRKELQSTASHLTGSKTILEGPLDTVASQRRNDVSLRFNNLLGDIRRRPGFEQFMLPLPATELSKVSNDLKGSVVMINVNGYRCDAFLLHRGVVSLLPLPALRIDDVSKWAGRLAQSGTKDGLSSPIDDVEAMAEMLKWLWDALARPVLDKLGYNTTPVGDNWPRIWWIPTGVLSNLPLHAAGRHSDASNDNVMDCVISSYSSSIKALMSDFHGSLPFSRTWIAKKVTLSAVHEGLPFVKDEAEQLSKLWRAKSLDVVATTQKSAVLSHIKQCTVFHFAGHGCTNARDPSQSFLRLSHGPENMLTVNDLQGETAAEHMPFLAYLSACSTGANRAQQLADESIHLIGASQLAGFRHVIGTLWEVSDKYCPEVAQKTYETILRQDMADGLVSRGLHDALRCLRHKMMRSTGEVRGQRDATVSFVSKPQAPPDTSRDLTYTWVPYVHYGL